MSECAGELVEALNATKSSTPAPKRFRASKGAHRVNGFKQCVGIVGKNVYTGFRKGSKSAGGSRKRSVEDNDEPDMEIGDLQGA